MAARSRKYSPSIRISFGADWRPKISACEMQRLCGAEPAYSRVPLRGNLRYRLSLFSRFDEVAANRNVPRQAAPFDSLQNGKQDHADDREQDDRGELAGDVQVRRRHHDDEPEPAVRADEFGHHRADDGENDRYLHAGENAGQ